MNDRIRFAVRCLSAALVVSAVWAPVARGDDAPPPPPQPTILEALFVPARQAISKLPPFLGDTDLKVHFRSYYFNRTNPDDTVNEAYALGGWIAYQSGWLFDTFAMGATLYGSAPIYTPPIATVRCSSSPGRMATTSRARPGVRSDTRSMRSSGATASRSTRGTSTRRTTG